ncbi:MAG TPA: hypothetical protein VHE30_22345 [Polyangiaceae bacterium]|nr:hypothetical protein [Polyangiaceae bacterium]
MWKGMVGVVGLGASLAACSADGAGSSFSGGGGNSGGSSGSGGLASQGNGGAASGGTPGASGGSPGGVGNGGVQTGDGGPSAGGGGGATAVGGATGAGGAIPKPYCNGQSADLGNDMYNCGECGNICQPEIVAYGLEAPSSIVADSTSLYWAERTQNGRVFQLPLGSSNVQNPPAIATNQKNPHSLALSATNVYWIADDAVWTRPKASGIATSIATDPAGRGFGDVAVDQTSVYFTTHSDSAGRYAAVKKIPLGGGAASEIATLDVTDFGAIAVNDAKVFFVHTEYYGSITSGNHDEIVYTVPLDGGTPVELTRFSPHVSILQLRATSQYLYIGINERQPGIPPTVYLESRVMRVPVAGGDPEWIVGTIDETFSAFDVNSQGTFLASSNGTVVGGSIHSTPNGIGMSMALALPTHPTALAVTETHLYYGEWEDNGLGNGQLFRNGLCVGSVCQ